MTWAKIDDRMPEHPKVIGISDKAFRLYVTSICYASANRTSGEILPAALARIGGTTKLAEELVTAVLWDTTSRGGWTVHDYLKYNRSKERIDEISESRREAGNKSAASRYGVVEQPANNLFLSGSGSVDPDPHPPKANGLLPAEAEKQNRNNLLTSEETDEAVGRLCRVWESATGTTVSKMLGDRMASNLDVLPEEAVAKAITQTGLNGAKSWNYTQTILDRYRQQGWKDSEPEETDATSKFKNSRFRVAQ